MLKIIRKGEIWIKNLKKVCFFQKCKRYRLLFTLSNILYIFGKKALFSSFLSKFQLFWCFCAFYQFSKIWDFKKNWMTLLKFVLKIKIFWKLKKCSIFCGFLGKRHFFQVLYPNFNFSDAFAHFINFQKNLIFRTNFNKVIQFFFKSKIFENWKNGQNIGQSI